MKFRLGWIVGFAVLLLSLISAQAQSYDEEMRLGVEAYKGAHYDDAMKHFRKATELDPAQTDAHLYLATTYMSQFIPGVEDRENVQMAQQAIEQYHRVLDSDAETTAKVTSNKGIAYLYLNRKKWDEAQAYYQKASALDPDDPETYYSIGVIDWMRCYQPRMERRATLGMRPDENLNARDPEQKKLCDELRVKNAATIEDGIENLRKAIALRSDYDDAMAYMNLMYREKADLECDDSSLREQDLKTADEWVDKTMATKKRKAQKAADSRQPNPGIDIDHH